MSEGGFRRQDVIDWLTEHCQWRVQVDHDPPLRITAIAGHRVIESHRDTIERWMANGKDPIPLGRFDEILLAHGVHLFEFEIEYPDSYVEG